MEVMDYKLLEIEKFFNLNLKINEGQITSIIGKNSRGKTSFLNLIFGTKKLSLVNWNFVCYNVFIETRNSTQT